MGTVKSSTTDATHELSGTGKENFNIGQDDGIIKLEKTLDYETAPNSYSLMVKAKARGESAEVPLTITVTNVGPAFAESSYSKTVAENAAVNSEVITVKSSTEGAEHALSGAGKGDFDIGKTTGVITVKSLDYETTNSYSLTVTASAGGESTDVPLTVTVTDVGPSFGKASYGFTVAEDQDKPHKVGTVTASPAGAEYTLSGDNAGDFKLDKDTGVITVQVTLDYETTNSYSLTVMAQDSDKEKASVPVTITVTNVGPSFGKASYGFTVAENVESNAEVGKVTASPAGAEYALSGSPDFTVHKDTGVITVKQDLDYEKTESYSLTVTATDSDNEPASVKVTITVTDAGPRFGKASYSFTVAESTAKDAAVGTVTASPESGFTGVTYGLTGTGNGDFTIDKDSGQITVAKGLDYETTPSYDLMVKAESATPDQGVTRKAEVTLVPLTISVGNVGPSFGKASYGFTVAEDKAKPYKVGTVTALLTGDFAGFESVKHRFEPSSSVFSIDETTGVITVAGALDYSQGSYKLNVRATPVKTGAAAGDPGNVSVRIGPPGKASTPAASSGAPAARAAVKEHLLGFELSVMGEPVAVGEMVSYTLTLTNRHNVALTNLTWRDVTFGGAAQTLADLAPGASVTVSGSVGPVQAIHLPGIILTFVADSDQTDERLASGFVTLTDAAIAAPQPAALPAASMLTIRVVRAQFAAPDTHLAHNIPDLTLTLDGADISCGFLTHYEATGGLTRWGHATSEVLEESPNSLTQYYQRGAVDCQMRDGEWRIERRLAWDYVGGGVAGAPDLGVEPGLLSEQSGDLIGPWGHRVSNFAVDGTEIGFMDFFNELGGVQAFGYPKTDARYDDDSRAVLNIAGATAGIIRQYFQAAVMEYHPGIGVQLRLLGDDLRDRTYPDQGYAVFGSFNSAAPVTAGDIYSAERVVMPSAPAAYTQAVVEQSLRRYDAEGREATVAHYNSAASVMGDWYVFVIDANDGLAIAHPTVPANVGQDINGPLGTDVTGYNFGADIVAATEDGAWVSYVYLNPATGEAGGTKHTWVVKRDGLLFGSGWYE